MKTPFPRVPTPELKEVLGKRGVSWEYLEAKQGITGPGQCVP